jgi:hypothetical protein
MNSKDIPHEFIKWLQEQKEPITIFYNVYETEVVFGEGPLTLWHWYIKEYGKPEPEDEIRFKTDEDYSKFIDGSLKDS